jgi:hypothetical protein
VRADESGPAGDQRLSRHDPGKGTRAVGRIPVVSATTRRSATMAPDAFDPEAAVRILRR